MMRRICACLPALVLAACGGGGQGSFTEAAAQKAPQALAQQAADPTTGALRVFQAFNGRAPTAVEFNAFSSPNAMVLATGFASSLSAMGDAALATAVLANMGVTAQSVNANSYAILQTALTQYFGAYGPSARGVIVNNLVGLLAGLESDATWGAPARSFNTAINTARAVVTASTTGGGTNVCTPSVVTGFAADIETAAAGAGDGGGSGSGGGAAAGGGLGKVLGGTMTVTDLSTGNVVGTGTTDSATGLVTIKTCSLAGPFLLALEGKAGARYFDEGKNTLVDFPAGSVLHALVDQWDEHVGVSPLTEAAYRYALNNFKASAADIAAGRAALRAEGSLTGLTKAQVQQANAIVLAEMNKRLASNYQVLSVKSLPTPIDASSGRSALPDSRYGRSAAANGGLVQSAQHYNPASAAPALAVSEQLARDLTDGRIDGFAADRTPVAPADRTVYESVRLPVGMSVATNALASRFAVGTLQPGELRTDETADAQWRGPTPFVPDTSIVDCNAFSDDAALMSDGSVTVLRRSPTQGTDGKCRFLFTPTERVTKLANFLTGIKSLGRGGGVAYAVKTDGTVMGWGDNYCGRLSAKLPSGRYPDPVVIPGLRNVTSIRSQFSGTIARDNTGAMYYWGFKAKLIPGFTELCEANLFNQGVSFDHYRPIEILRASVSNVVEVYVYANNYFALTAEGEVYAWGDGFGGLLANSNGLVVGTVLRAPEIETPTKITGLGPVRQLVFTDFCVFALMTDGTVMAWGDDKDMLLGRGTQLRTLRPTPTGLTNVAQLAASDFHGLRILRNDGSVMIWGRVSQDTAYLSPTVVTPTERVRAIVGFDAGLNVHFGSGRVGFDVLDTSDISQRFR